MTTSDGAVTHLKRTPLYEEHKALSARLIDFGGWEMPVQYTSILQEHQAVRTHAGLFDVSHMGEFKVEGADSLAFLQYLVPNDVSKLALQQALYTQLCTPAGMVIDDLLVYHLSDEHYMLVVNAANIAKDLAWVQEQARAFPNVTVVDLSSTTALLALQGPKALRILGPLTIEPLADIKYYHSISGRVAEIDCIISRTGYTGEDGFELYCPSGDAADLWKALLAAGQPLGLLPAGLGARDTLRLEAGLCLYGHELDDSTNPLEAKLGWTVKFNKGDFIGREALLKVKEEGPARLITGIELLDRGIPRGGYPLYDGDQQIGTLTSGAPGPTVKKNVGIGYVPASYAKPGRPIQIDIRGKRLAAQTASLPFYKRSL